VQTREFTKLCRDGCGQTLTFDAVEHFFRDSTGGKHNCPKFRPRPRDNIVVDNTIFTEAISNLERGINEIKDDIYKLRQSVNYFHTQKANE